ncbi:hypothetical protein [Bacillus rubiinfantis]|uniref:hypothetical protein n=1 Tax=Bacillus rubiinfantis TaxID=1499680 RepID=UPI0005A6B5DD|nr:hypothetical protein [Bacillus rubiinfantis]
MYLEKLLIHLEKYKVNGYMETKFSRKFSFKREVLGEKMFEHLIYRGLNLEELNNLLKRIDIPNIYQDFLKELNGFDFFEGEVSLFGRNCLEKGMSREEQMQQPKNIIEENEFANFDKELYLLIGVYYETEVFLIQKNTEEILEVSLNSGIITGVWEEFYIFLEYLLNKTFKN